MAEVQLWDRIPYYTAKATNVLNLSEVYSNVATLTTPVILAGKYEFSFSLSFNINSTSNKVYIRWRTNGGAWNEFIHESKDSTSITPLTYFYPNDFVSQVHTFEFEMRKQTSSNTLNVNFLDLILKKVAP